MKAKKKCKDCDKVKGKVWIQTDLANYTHGAFQQRQEEMLEDGYSLYIQIGGTPPPGCGPPPKTPCLV